MTSMRVCTETSHPEPTPDVRHYDPFCHPSTLDHYTIMPLRPTSVYATMFFNGCATCHNTPPPKHPNLCDPLYDAACAVLCAKQRVVPSAALGAVGVAIFTVIRIASRQNVTRGSAPSRSLRRRHRTEGPVAEYPPPPPPTHTRPSQHRLGASGEVCQRAAVPASRTGPPRPPEADCRCPGQDGADQTRSQSAAPPRPRCPTRAELGSFWNRTGVENVPY